MTGIEAMAGDFQRAMDEYAADARKRVSDAAREAANRAASASSPLYGVAVRTAVSTVGDTTRITADVVRTDGIGTLYGGTGYADRRVREIVDKSLREAGLDLAG